MGCCVSTSNNKNGASKPHHVNKKLNTGSRSPPPPSPPPPPPAGLPLPEEERVVKEVLSERPSLPKPTISSFHENEPKKAMLLPHVALPHQDDEQNDSVLKKPRMVFNPDELSEETSEICSTLSECVSAPTDHKRDTNDELYDDVDDGVSNIRQRPPMKVQNRQVCGERQLGKPAAKRSEPSPGRVRFGPGKDDNGLVGNGQRRGPVMSSDRRSRSPATPMEGSGSRTDLGRCPSARRTGKSPGRVGPEVSEKARKVMDANVNGIGVGNMSPPTSNESLENPLVSLECFIFL